MKRTEIFDNIYSSDLLYIRNIIWLKTILSKVLLFTNVSFGPKVNKLAFILKAQNCPQLYINMNN